jgi:predicted  nucleic acid-binding Zn-ribbon protein
MIGFMSDHPDNIILAFLRRFDTKLDALQADIRDLKHRVTAVEIQVANVASASASHYASLASRMDRAEDRLDRIEKRLAIVSD